MVFLPTCPNSGLPLLGNLRTFTVALDMPRELITTKLWFPHFPHSVSVLSNFLYGRSVAEVVGGYHSSPIPTNSGVPQGSVLSPTLCHLFISDLVSCTAVHFIWLSLHSVLSHTLITDWQNNSSSDRWRMHWHAWSLTHPSPLTGAEKFFLSSVPRKPDILFRTTIPSSSTMHSLRFPPLLVFLASR